MNQTSFSWSALVAVVSAIVSVAAFVYAYSASNAAQVAGSIAGSTHTAGYYVAGLGFQTSTAGDTSTLLTSSTATSSLVVGCVQMAPTSTATYVHLEFSTSTALATYSGGPVPTGAVAWRYGSCPR